jgi:uncharacterized protein (DUF4415 family)
MAIVTYTADELKRMSSATDWAKVDALTDEEITRAALSDPDNPPLIEDALLRMRPVKEHISITLNHEVVDFFKRHGKGWQAKLNDILQQYVDSHRAA